MRRCALLISFLFIVLTTHAQQPTRLPKVVVQASPLFRPDPLESADDTQITAKDIEQKQALTVVDVLRNMPGVYVSQHGGIGQEARVSLRGTGDANTTVLVNGMAIQDSGAFDNTPNLSRWLVDDVSKIQVIRGPMSSLYGSGGMGGIVLIETKKGEGPHKNFAKAEAGSFNTYSQNVGIQGQRDFVDYHIVGSRIQSMGAVTTPPGYRSQVYGKLDNPLHQENLTARLGVGREFSHISVFSRCLTRRLGSRQLGFILDPAQRYPFRQDYSESFNRLQGHFETASGRWYHDLGLGHYQNDLTVLNPAASKVARNASQTQVDWRQSYDLTNSLQFQVAMDYSQEKLYWYKLPSLNNNFRASHKGIGGTVSYRIYENLMITGSTRIDKYQGFTSHPTYRFGGQYSFEKILMKANIGTAFNAPTLQQKFYKDSYSSGNPNLKPVKSVGWDWGIERPFFQNLISLGVTLFQNRIRDLITSVRQGGIWTSINLNKTRTQGAEGLIRIYPSSEWTLELTHTYTQAWDEKTNLGIVGNPLNKTTVNVNGQITSHWQVSGDILYISPRDTYDAVTFNPVRTPSYTIVGTQTSYQLTDIWQVYGRAENLFNRTYENPRNFQQPGFGIYVGLRAQC